MKLMTYQNPLATLDSFFSDPFDLFAPFFETSKQSRILDPVEWFEDDENYYARVDLPGVSRDELSIEFDAELISFSISKDTEGCDSSREWKLRAPEGIEVDRAEANLNDGVLTLLLPKAPEQKPVTIEVE